MATKSAQIMRRQEMLGEFSQLRHEMSGLRLERQKNAFQLRQEMSALRHSMELNFKDCSNTILLAIKDMQNSLLLEIKEEHQSTLRWMFGLILAMAALLTGALGAVIALLK